MTFDDMMREVMTGADRFGHRQHVHLTWLAVRCHGTAEAIAVVSEGIQRTARYAGAPRKYHVTMSRAWVELVGHHVAGRSVPDRAPDADADPDPADFNGDDVDDFDDFDDFADRNPDLFDKRLLTRFYRSDTLAGDAARRGWVEPDVRPFPWQSAANDG